MNALERLSGWDDLTPRGARLYLAAIALAAATLVAISLSPSRKELGAAVGGGEGDVALYHAVVNRMRGGEGYYSAMAVELPARGYPSAKLLNWRTPGPMWLNAQLPAGGGKAVLCSLAFFAICAAFAAVRRDAGPATALVAAVLLTGPFLFCILGELYIAPVLWAGVLITLSLGLSGVGRPAWGIVCGVAAVFFRDLAGPYCAGSLLYSLWRRRWKEAAGWAAGITVYFICFAYHASMVASHRPVDAVSHAGGWIQFGGAALVISFVQMNAHLISAPQWAAALFLVAAIVGCLGPQSDWAARVSVAFLMYLTLFAFVGFDFNQYWGAMWTPLVCLCAARAPQVMLRLVRCGREAVATQTAPA